MNELQERDGGVDLGEVYGRLCVGGMRGSICNGDNLGYGKFRKNRILTEFLMFQFHQ